MPTLSSLLPAISFFFLFNLPPSILCGDDYRFTNCYQEFGCGPFNNISYPFWSSDIQPEYCGRMGFQLQCEYGIPTIQIMSQQYRVMKIKPESQTLIIARNDIWKGNCVTGLYDHNTLLDHTVFTLSDSANQNLNLFYDCPPSLPFTDKFQCEILGSTSDAWISSDAHLIDMHRDLLNECRFKICVPVLRTGLSLVFNPKEQKIEDVLKVGFEVKYSVNVSICEGCEKSGGRCGFNRTTPEFTCFCRDGPNQLRCKAFLTPTAFVATVHGSKKMKNVIIGVGAGAGVLLLACVFFLICLRRKKHQSKSSALISRSLTPDSSIKPDLERGTSSYFQTPIFSYAELQEATDNFDSSKEIGDGGFGTVYHGTLRDGRVVAVKRLYENNYKRHDQFMNELKILSRLRHRNLVTLYGCTTRHSRELLLVYEYIPNGTVADNLHGDRASTSPLTWPVRLSVAIETADALSYLHASDIIHRDVKTNNILLDHNFHVKVADFGLSRLFPMNATHVSTAPQGTPGYVDPEYYQCYQLNDKSDVYSFGVVLIELISSKPAVDIGRHRHEINLSNMAINKIHNDALHELVDPSLGFESDYSVRRMITMVAELAFRCLQQEKDMRPGMMEVLKCLKDIESAEKVEKAEEVDIPADARLLKNVPPFSPTSVTDKWVSSTTTPNTSG